MRAFGKCLIKVLAKPEVSSIGIPPTEETPKSREVARVGGDPLTCLIQLVTVWSSDDPDANLKTDMYNGHGVETVGSLLRPSNSNEPQRCFALIREDFAKAPVMGLKKKRKIRR